MADAEETKLIIEAFPDRYITLRLVKGDVSVKFEFQSEQGSYVADITRGA